MNPNSLPKECQCFQGLERKSNTLCSHMAHIFLLHLRFLTPKEGNGFAWDIRCQSGDRISGIGTSPTPASWAGQTVLHFSSRMLWCSYRIFKQWMVPLSYTQNCVNSFFSFKFSSVSFPTPISQNIKKPWESKNPNYSNIHEWLT